MGMSKHDAYYEPEDDDILIEEIEARTHDLMKTPDYTPWDSGHMAEALSELDVKTSEDLQVCLDLRNFEQIGRKIWSITYDYMESFAKAQATSEIQD
jgi:hypothetical protein